MSAAHAATFNQLNLVVRDVDATVTFYCRLGMAIEAEPGSPHVEIKFGNGVTLEIDSVESVSLWDTGSRGTTGGSNVLGCAVASREAVDTLYSDIVAAGYRGRQPPYDAFWGARYAIVEDPDGNGVGLMSPIDRSRRFWPPSEPPKAANS